MAAALTMLSCQSEIENPELALENTSSSNLSSKSVELSITSYSASRAHSCYPARNAFDRSTSTRWTSDGIGEYLDIDLGESNTVDYVKVAHYRGSSRTYKFKVYTRTSTSINWSQVGNKTSSRSNSLQTYDLSNSTARYIRVESNGNTTNNWTDITEVEIWATGDSDGGSTGKPSSDYPGGILGISNDDWKLNGFTATPRESATYYDDVMDQVNGNISTWSNDDYFYEKDGWAVFECYRGLGTSENSSNPQTELRELDGNGNLASWDNEDNLTMKFTVKVDQLSNNVNNDNGVVCVGQIHGPSDNDKVDDIVRVPFYGDAGQTSGNVRIKISGDVADANGGSEFIDNGYKLDTSYVVTIQYKSDDSVIVKIDGKEIYNEKMDEDEDENYFKVGCYLQESKGASFDGSSAKVYIKDLSIY